MSNIQTGHAVIDEVLSTFPDPETGRSALQMGQISDVQLDGDQLTLTLALTTYSAPIWEATREALRAKLAVAQPSLEKIELKHAVHSRPPEKLGEIGLTAKSVIAVGSGKGGVGKSTIAASIALGLKKAGCKVGLMDADVYGPSIPHLLGVSGHPEVFDRPAPTPEDPEATVRKLKPIFADGMPVMSIGFVVEPGEAVVWRGPMLHGAITQFLRDTDWGDLDYLIIDMPPGTGDIALTLSQLLPLTGSVIVCTPQDVALLDAVKAIAMFGKVGIDVLGIVENMSYFECANCNERHDIFGSGGARKKAAELEVPFLGEVPINISIRIRGDEGKTAENLTDKAAAEYLAPICERIVQNIATARKAAPPMPSLPVL